MIAGCECPGRHEGIHDATCLLPSNPLPRKRWVVEMLQPITMVVLARTSETAEQAALTAHMAIVGGMAVQTACCGIPQSVTVKEE